MTDRMFRTELVSAEAPARRRTPWLVGITVTILILIVLGFVAVRLSVDVPSIAAGTVPDDAYDARFVRHPWLTHLHIGPGVLYMVGATLQLAYWFRRRHYAVHRRLGRILLGAGPLSGAMAVVIGLFFPIGGPGEVSATVLFGVWFLVCLALAFRAIRADDIVRHRRWMIRAFRDRSWGRHHPRLDRIVRDHWPTGSPRGFRASLLDLVHHARFGCGTLAARPPAATGNDH
jgi:uncharacterized membrane protein